MLYHKICSDFCWVCLGEWKKHGDAYYECSRYKEDPKVVNENRHAKAREALKKYLFYFHRVSYMMSAVHRGGCNSIPLIEVVELKRVVCVCPSVTSKNVCLVS